MMKFRARILSQPNFCIQIIFIIISITSIASISFLFSISFPLFISFRFPSSDGQKNLTKVENNPTKIAVCLIGGARRFELTGPSIVDRVLRAYPNADLFLNSPLDSNSYKLFLLNEAPRIAAVKIFRPQPIPETQAALRVLTSSGSPNGVQGLLQYFNLVEGCLTMIKAHQEKHNFTYDWIIRSRVDGYWSEPLDIKSFDHGKYTVPIGSSYKGLNDRFGAGSYNTSLIALSRLSLIPQLDSTGLTRLNSESAFKAQLTTNKVNFTTTNIPFCILSDRKYNFRPTEYNVPVASISSKGPLNGAKCRPCMAACNNSCAARVMNRLHIWWSRIRLDASELELCDGHGDWEKGWEILFDKVAGKKYASIREKIWGLDMGQCIYGLEKMRKKAAYWDAPEAQEICKMGLERL